MLSSLYLGDLKTNMDTQTDGLEKVTPLKNGNFLVSMLDFSCVDTRKQTRPLKKGPFLKELK